MSKLQQIEYFYINNTKIANMLRKKKDMDIVNMQETDIGGGKASYYVSSQLSYFDMVVADAIYTLYRSGFENINPRLIMRVMSGNFEQVLSPAKRNPIVKSIEKLRNTEIVIKEQRKNAKRKNIAVQGAFLPCTKLDGKQNDRYQLTEKMPLYEYAEEAKQMIAIPINIYQANVQADTEQMILIRHYVLQRISVYYNGKNSYNDGKIVLLKGSYNGKEKHTGMLVSLDMVSPYYEASESKRVLEQRVKRVKIRVKNLLDHYKEIGWITAFVENDNVIELKKL